MARRPRTRKSYAVEFALALVAVLVIWAFLVGGGPAWLGPIIAEYFGQGAQ